MLVQCGHGAFSANKRVNDIVGFVSRSSCPEMIACQILTVVFIDHAHVPLDSLLQLADFASSSSQQSCVHGAR